MKQILFFQKGDKSNSDRVVFPGSVCILHFEIFILSVMKLMFEISLHIKNCRSGKNKKAVTHLFSKFTFSKQPLSGLIQQTTN